MAPLPPGNAMPLHLDPIITGNEAGETILFVQGWPDDASLWDEAVAAVGGTYRCVRVNLPNYDGRITTRWGYDTEEIVDAIKKALHDKDFREKVSFCKNPYGDGKAGKRIVKILGKVELGKKLLEKRMTY